MARDDMQRRAIRAIAEELGGLTYGEAATVLASALATAAFWNGRSGEEAATVLLNLASRACDASAEVEQMRGFDQ